jgi:glycosyltransferase involved in cell wall biosynthesis
MNIAFYSNRIQFDGTFLEKQGLGGSESALINLSTCWKQVFPEDRVTVFNTFYRKAEEVNGVIWKGIIDFKSECKNANWDVFISLREPEPLLEPFIDSKLKFFWSQDDMNESGLQAIAGNQYLQNRIDTILVISNHSFNDIKRVISTPLFLMRNGYRKDWITEGNGTTHRESVAVYSSTPFRGLDVLAEVWPKIYEGCMKYGIAPELRTYTGMALYQQADRPAEQQLYNALKQMPKVTQFGPIPQRVLYNELKKARVMLYPNHFLETGCMAVLEALASGVWVVTSDLGALPEQVIDGKNGFIVKGNAHSPEYKEKFIEKAIDSLTNDYMPDSTGLIFSWQEQVERLRNYIYNLLE